MGATSAVHVVDDALRGADLLLTADVLAAAIRRTGFDLVIAGNLSTDGGGGVVPAMVAELLGVPQLTALSSLDIADDTVSGERVSDAGTMRVSASLPAVVSVTEALPRGASRPSRASWPRRRSPSTPWMPPTSASWPKTGAGAVHHAVGRREAARAAGTKIVDEGDAGEKLAAFLLAEGVA